MPHSTAWRSLYSAGSKAGGRPPARPLFLRWRIWSAFSGWCRRCPVCAGTRGWPGSRRPCQPAPGRAAQGRPGHGRGTRMPASTAWNWGLSPRWPAVIRIDSGFWPCSQARCTLVVSPPRNGPVRDQPLGHRPAGRLGLQITAPAGPGRVLVRPGDGGVHGHIPGDQPLRIGPALQPGQDLAPGAVALPAAEQAIHRLPRPVGRRHIAPRRASPHPPPDPVNQRAPGCCGRPRFPPGGSGPSTAHCASVRSARLLTAKVATRSPCRWSSWSLTHLPETSSVTGQRPVLVRRLRHVGECDGALLSRDDRDCSHTLTITTKPSSSTTCRTLASSSQVPRSWTVAGRENAVVTTAGCAS